MNILQPVVIDSTPSKILRYLSLQKWTRRIRVRGLKQRVKAIVLFNFFCYWLIALQDVFSAVIQSVHSFMPEGVMPCVLLFSSHFLLFLSVQTHCAATVLLTRKSKEKTRTSGWKIENVAIWICSFESLPSIKQPSDGSWPVLTLTVWRGRLTWQTDALLAWKESVWGDPYWGFFGEVQTFIRISSSRLRFLRL